MTNQRTERLPSGRVPGRRGSRCGRGVGLGLLLIGLLAAAAPIRAAEVVEVRVGRHPEFTRVVFELDRAAGYRIERSDPNAKTSELIISLEAGSIPRRIQSSKSLIETVVVEPNGPRSIARIRLARGGLRLKEMILASPPRIVLDVISEKDGATTTTASTVAPAQSAATAPKPPVTSVATQSATKPATQPAPKPTAIVADAAPTTKSVPLKTESPAPQTRVLASTEDPEAKKPSPAPSLGADLESADAIANAAANAGADAGTNAPSEWNDGGAASGSEGGSDPNAAAIAAGGADARPPEPAAAEAPKARPMMVKSTKSEDEGGGLMTWALAGVGLAVVAFGGLVVARRRAANAEGDEDEDGDHASEDEDDGEEDEEEGSSSSASSNPFAELTGGSASLAAGTTRASASVSRPADKRVNQPTESLLFDDAEEKTMEGMEVVSRSQTNEALGGAMPMMGAGSDEITQMFREMQRRVAALEGRIDELVDARDRLERQVAAQTEELRVQRAAIARTQRAVRNLARPDEGNDDEPTEPALRDPN